MRKGKQAKPYTATSFKAFSEKGHDGEGAVAQRRNSTTRRDANKLELIDFEQEERTTDDK